MKKPGIDRRALLTGAAVTGLAACTEAAGPAPADGPSAPATVKKRRELTMVTTWPKNYPGLGAMAERTAALIGELSEGSLTVKVYADRELVPAFEAFDAVVSGAADMYHGAEYYWQGKSKGFNFFTAVPMGLTASEMMAWVDHGGGQELWEELSGEFGLIAFQAGTTGVQMGGWFKREIKSLEDWRGLKMRIPGLGGEVVRALGGAAVAVSGTEIFSALQQGAIDATEWVGPWNDLAFGFYRIAPYYYGPGFHEPGSILSCGISRKVWDSLTPHEQTIVRTACAWANNLSIGEYEHQNAVALKTLREAHGVELRAFPDDTWKAVGGISKTVLADVAASDPLTGRIYESFMAARGRAISWSGFAEGGYLRARALAETG